MSIKPADLFSELDTAVDLHSLPAAAINVNSWPDARAVMYEQVVVPQYGPLPPKPLAVQSRILNTSRSKVFGGGAYETVQICAETPVESFTFTMMLTTPAGNGPFPVMVCGDGCWPYVTMECVLWALKNGFAVALFNRTELAPDTASLGRECGIYPHYPDLPFGALAAWAWGFQRCVDALSEHPSIDSSKIGVTGHSRGGKASLLAGATDERIAFVSANNSGCGGAGCHHVHGDNCEKLEHILANFPYWFTPDLQRFIGKDADLPFDQHLFKAMVAPRPLLTTEAIGDLWANPYGSWLSHLAASEIYAKIGHPDAIATRYREGGHAYTFADWQTILSHASILFDLSE
mgnify:CR=1 FL=1